MEALKELLIDELLDDMMLATFLLINCVGFIAAIPSSASFSCPPQHFSCNNASCIPNLLLCDGDLDCSNGADEDQLNCITEEEKYPGSTASSTVSFLPIPRAEGDTAYLMNIVLPVALCVTCLLLFGVIQAVICLFKMRRSKRNEDPVMAPVLSSQVMQSCRTEVVAGTTDLNATESLYEEVGEHGLKAYTCSGNMAGIVNPGFSDGADAPSKDGARSPRTIAMEEDGYCNPTVTFSDVGDGQSWKSGVRELPGIPVPVKDSHLNFVGTHSGDHNGLPRSWSQTSWSVFSESISSRSGTGSVPTLNGASVDSLPSITNGREQKDLAIPEHVCHPVATFQGQVRGQGHCLDDYASLQSENTAVAIRKSETLPLPDYSILQNEISQSTAGYSNRNPDYANAQNGAKTEQLDLSCRISSDKLDWVSIGSYPDKGGTFDLDGNKLQPGHCNDVLTGSMVALKGSQSSVSESMDTGAKISASEKNGSIEIGEGALTTDGLGRAGDGSGSVSEPEFIELELDTCEARIYDYAYSHLV